MKVKVKVAQLCPTLCNPMDYTVHGILQARVLEWVAFPFSRGSSQPRDQNQESNPGLPHCRQILHQLSHQGSPQLRNLEVIQRHSILTATFEEGRNGQRAEF